MPDLLLLPLLVVAIGIGWLLGRWGRERQSAPPQAALTRDYFIGLNYLLNEKPDQAIETFIKALEVNSDTVETHIALGNLFRARGESDKAVRVHQNLFARPTLDKRQSLLVQLELARDYMAAGLLDRAERLLLELTEESDAEIRRHSRKQLVEVYQREREWRKAIDTAVPALIQDDPQSQRAVAHYCCELAAEYLADNDFGRARKQLKQALYHDKGCVRATLLQGQLECMTGRYKSAIKQYRRIEQQDKDFLPEVLEPVAQCYERLNDRKGLQSFLRESIRDYPYASAVLRLAAEIRKEDGDAAARDFMKAQVKQHPSIRGVGYLLDLYVACSDEQTREDFQLLGNLTQRLADSKPAYRCKQCGFEGSQLHWQCPKCKNWGTVRPILGIEGE